MSNESTSKSPGECHRRQYLAGIAGAASLALAGCSGGTSGSGGTTTQDPCLKDHSQEFCRAEDFLQDVKQRVESAEPKDGADPPQLLEGGVATNDNGEPITDTVVLQMVAESPDSELFPSTLSEDVGYVGGAFAYFIDDYDYDIERMTISVLASSEGDQYLGKLAIFREWARKFNNDEWSSADYVNTIMQTWDPA